MVDALIELGPRVYFGDRRPKFGPPCPGKLGLNMNIWWSENPLAHHEIFGVGCIFPLCPQCIISNSPILPCFLMEKSLGFQGFKAPGSGSWLILGATPLKMRNWDLPTRCIFFLHFKSQRPESRLNWLKIIGAERTISLFKVYVGLITDID